MTVVYNRDGEKATATMGRAEVVPDFASVDAWTSVAYAEQGYTGIQRWILSFAEVGGDTSLRSRPETR